MKAVGYVRVSTEEQVRGGVSLDMQRAKIRAYAALEGLQLVEIIADEGISGCSIKIRPGIQRVLQLVRERQVEAVIIYKLDRLARNTLETLEIARLMDQKGVALHSITEKLDTGSALGRFFFTLVASLAEMERGIISERIKAAMGRLKEAGRTWNGNPPYGLQARDGLLIPHEQERTVINRIWCLRDEGHTIHKIAAILDNEGIRNRRNREFGKSQIHTIIQRKVT